jgi:5-carboxymethyl-2-hydroxymuconate isomerase
MCILRIAEFSNYIRAENLINKLYMSLLRFIGSKDQFDVGSVREKVPCLFPLGVD